MADRIRLSEKARQRLINLSNQADLEPSFLLEYLINRHGNEAISALGGGQPSTAIQSRTIEPSTPPQFKIEPIAESSPTVDFATLIANA